MLKLLNVVQRFLISRDLAIVLLILFTGNAAVNMLGWQAIAPVELKPTFLNAFLTYSFYISGILLSINLLACSLQRIRQEIRGTQNRPFLKESFSFSLQDNSREVHEKIQKALAQKGYVRFKREGSTLSFRKGYGGRWGSIMYHASLLVIVWGIFSLNQSRFEGTLFLTEGQSFTLGDKLITAKEPEQELTSDRPFRITLDKFDITYKGESPVESAAHLKVEEEGKAARSEKIKINYPLEVRGIAFMLQNFDYSPRFVFKDDGGQPFFDSYVNLFINKGHQDFFQIPDSPLTVFVKLYPDAELQKGQPVNLSLNPLRPLFWVQLRSGDQVLGEQYLRLNQFWKTPAGTLGITDLSHFIQLTVTKEQGSEILVTGFALTLLGLIIRFFLVERVISLNLTDEGRLILAGEAEYYQNIFKEEFNELVREIKGCGLKCQNWK